MCFDDHAFGSFSIYSVLNDIKLVVSNVSKKTLRSGHGREKPSGYQHQRLV